MSISKLNFFDGYTKSRLKFSKAYKHFLQRFSYRYSFIQDLLMVYNIYLFIFFALLPLKSRIITPINPDISEFQGYPWTTKLIESGTNRFYVKRTYPTKFIENFTKIRSYPDKLQQIKDFYKDLSHKILDKYYQNLTKSEREKNSLSIIKMLSALCMLDLKEEFHQCTNIIFSNFTLEGTFYIEDFIPQVVGNFISAYQFTDNMSFLYKAKEFADLVLPYFTFSHTVRISYENGIPKTSSYENSECAEKYTIYPLEFITLSILSDDPKYMQHTMRRFKTILRDHQYETGLNQKYYYLDMLVKSYHLIGDAGLNFIELFLKYINDVREKRPINKVTDEYRNYYLPGTMMMAMVKKNHKIEQDKNYSKLALNEIIKNLENIKSDTEPYFATLSSLFVFYRIEGLKEYRDFAWELFDKIKKMDVDDYTLGSLMYIYLIHSDNDFFSLDDYVISHDGVPFKIFKEVDTKKWGPFLEYRGYTMDEIKKRYSDLTDFSKYF